MLNYNSGQLKRKIFRCALKIMQKVRLLILLVVSALVAACSDDSAGTGSSLLTDADGIVVGCDTFSLHSEMVIAPDFNSAPDSLLLGEADNMFGTIDADILTQFACPIDFRYPEGSEVDSVVLFMNYNSWYGDGKSPFRLSVYQMDLATFDYNTPYPYDLDVTDYCSFEDSTALLYEDKVLTAKGYIDSLAISSTAYAPMIRLRMKQEFAERFFACNDFSSQEKFNEQFKGLYITTTFGGSTVLYVTSISMAVYYHFSYNRLGSDTIVRDAKLFYANSEVRQVNRVTYPKANLETLIETEDSVSYVVSPANIFTRLRLPMQKMSESIRDTLGQRRAYVNQAKLEVRVLNQYNGAIADITRDDWAQPAATMMLIKEDAVERFFLNNELPSDTCAILATLTTTSDTIGNMIYSYTFDVAQLLTRQLRQADSDESLYMILMPVSVGTTTMQATSYSTAVTSISSVKPQQTISATAIKSAHSEDNPMELRVTYSGF